MRLAQFGDNTVVMVVCLMFINKWIIIRFVHICGRKNASSIWLYLNKLVVL